MTNEAFDSVIFDLDGTLVDSSADIIHSLQTAYRLAGVDSIPAMSSEHIGPRLAEVIQQLTPMLDAVTRNKVVFHYRSIYDSIQQPQSRLYPNVRAVLDFLSEKNIKSFIATNKPQSATLPLLAYFEIKHYFCDILTPTSLNGIEISKTQMIHHIIAINKLDSQKTLMVGDHVHDIEAGWANNTKTAAFLQGYSKPETLSSSNPDYLIHDLIEITKLI